jgi:hypothetical protein
VGDRIPLPKNFTAGELLALTEATRDEWGVAINHSEGGMLELLHGNPETFPQFDNEQFLVHGHTEPTSTWQAISGEGGDVTHAQGVYDDWGVDQPQAVIDSTGTVHHFDRTGVVDNPATSPIRPDGVIDGGAHPTPYAPSPNTTP